MFKLHKLPTHGIPAFRSPHPASVSKLQSNNETFQDNLDSADTLLPSQNNHNRNRNSQSHFPFQTSTPNCRIGPSHKMGVPYSQEVKTAVDLAADLKFAVTCFIIILTIFLSFIVVAVIALLITVNPDLVEERKALVTPVLKLGLWGLTPIIWGRRIFVGTEEPREERRRDEGRGENENQSVHDSGRVQRRRRASPM
jgi:hypothetical protein